MATPDRRTEQEGAAPGPAGVEPPEPAPPRPEGASPAVEGAERVVRRVLGWLLRHVRNFYAAAGLLLTVALALSAVALWGFAEVAELALAGEPRAFELAAIRWVHGHATPALDAVALEITALGSNVVVGVWVVAASAIFWLARYRYSAVLLPIAVAGSAVLNRVLKLTFGRERPDLDLFEWQAHFPGTESFPSGHAMTSMVAYLTLAYLVARLQRRFAVRAATFTLAGLVVLLVGASRLYLGVHYPTDVVAGYSIGFAWASFCALLVRVVGGLPSPARHGAVRRPAGEAERE